MGCGLWIRYFWCNGATDVAFFTLDYIGDVIFLADIILSFRFAVLEDGIVINDRIGISE